MVSKIKVSTPKCSNYDSNSSCDSKPGSTSNSISNYDSNSGSSSNPNGETWAKPNPNLNPNPNPNPNGEEVSALGTPTWVKPHLNPDPNPNVKPNVNKTRNCNRCNSLKPLTDFD